MEDKKALEILKSSMWEGHGEYFLDVVQSKEMAQKALEKQIPKEPKVLAYKPLIEAGWEYECPSCGKAVGMNKNASDFTDEDDFCCSCGQKLDWSKCHA